MNAPYFTITSHYTALAREDFTGPWTTEFAAGSDPESVGPFTAAVADDPVDGPYVGVLLTSGELKVRQGLTGTWYDEYGTSTNHGYGFVKDFAIAEATT